MKRTVVLLLVVALLAGGVGLYLYKTHSPEYALLQTIKDVKERGVNGLYGHLTDDTYEIVDKWFNNPLVTSVIAFASQNDELENFRENLKEIEWTVQDVLKGRQSADVILGFKYKSDYEGTIKLSMVKEAGTWKIDKIGLPQFN